MVETPQAILDADGRSPLPRLPAPRRGPLRRRALRHLRLHRVVQHHRRAPAMDHPACDFAKAHDGARLAGTGVLLSDGATNVMPVGAAPRATALTAAQQRRRTAPSCTAPGSSRTGTSATRSSGGFYQGWDLHPAQLPVRYAAVLRLLPRGPRRRPPSACATSSRRPRRPRWSATCSTTPPPARACSTTSCARSTAAPSTVADLERTGLTPEELELRSFAKILAARPGRGSPRRLTSTPGRAARSPRPRPRRRARSGRSPPAATSAIRRRPPRRTRCRRGAGVPGTAWRSSSSRLRRLAFQPMSAMSPSTGTRPMRASTPAFSDHPRQDDQRHAHAEAGESSSMVKAGVVSSPTPGMSPRARRGRTGPAGPGTLNALSSSTAQRRSWARREDRAACLSVDRSRRGRSYSS